jgi:hypothetical protein
VCRVLVPLRGTASYTQHEAEVQHFLLSLKFRMNRLWAVDEFIIQQRYRYLELQKLFETKFKHKYARGCSDCFRVLKLRTCVIYLKFFSNKARVRKMILALKFRANKVWVQVSNYTHSKV